jgi:acyl-CoA synthetase (AMP-forming)/AMP-acid ligase II
VAASLVARRATGERVLLLFAPGLEFVTGFFGCLYAGAVAVPVQPPSRGRARRALPRLRGVAADARPVVALATADTIELMQPLLTEAPELAHIAWIDIDGIDVAASCEPTARADDLAFLQYTSGSTSTPRGVMVSHANLVANEEMIRRAFQQNDSSVVLTWLPHFHDMGLIGGLLQPCYVGGTCVAMAP